MNSWAYFPVTVILLTHTRHHNCVILGFHCSVNEMCALLRFHLHFGTTLSVPSSRVVPQTPVRNYHSTLPKTPEQCRPQQHMSQCTIMVTTAVQNYILLVRETPNSIIHQRVTINKTPTLRPLEFYK